MVHDSKNQYLHDTKKIICIFLMNFCIIFAIIYAD